MEPMKLKNILSALILISLVGQSIAFAGIGSKQAAYFGGSTKDADFPGAKGEVVGTLEAGNNDKLIFRHNLGGKGKTFEIPYDKFIDIEYGQKAGRRVGASIATAILLTPLGLFMLFSKKRKHYVTIGYYDADGREQVAVFELGKDIIRTTLPILEARSGKKIEYQDDEAKKSSKG
jgi:hypothetical protein